MRFFSVSILIPPFNIEDDNDAYSALWTVGNGDSASVKLDDFLADGQSQTSALPRCLGSEERVKNFVHLVLGNACTCIFDADHHHLRAARTPVILAAALAESIARYCQDSRGDLN